MDNDIKNKNIEPSAEIMEEKETAGGELSEELSMEDLEKLVAETNRSIEEDNKKAEEQIAAILSRARDQEFPPEAVKEIGDFANELKKATEEIKLFNNRQIFLNDQPEKAADKIEKEEPPKARPERVGEEEAKLKTKIERLDRDAEVVASLEKIKRGEKLSAEELEKFTPLIEKRGWNNLFSKLEKGHKVLSFLVNSNDNFSIKKLNDEILGYQKTNEFVDFKRNFLKNEIGRNKELSQTFKESYFDLGKAESDEEKKGMEELAEETVKKANERIKVLFMDILLPDAESEANEAISKIDKKPEAERSDEERNERERQEKRLKSIENFKAYLEKEGYSLTYGMSEVGEGQENKYADIELAVSNSLKGAMAARDIAGESMGSEMEAEDLKPFALELATAREALIGQDTISDETGRSYKIFEKINDKGEADENGKYVKLNTDLARAVRKWKFKPAEGQERILKDIGIYMKKVNMLDIVKPFTHDEIKDGANIASRLAENESIVERLNAGENLNEEEIAALERNINREAKDEDCTSAARFNTEALKINDCSYITIDALDIGVKLLQGFELMMQKIENGEMSPEEASKTAGDEMTGKMREFRKIIRETVQEHTGKEEVLMLAGGDEATIALPRDMAGDELLLKINERLSSADLAARVIKTAVGYSERSSSKDDAEKIKHEHLDAQKEAEKGAEIMKEIEALKRELDHYKKGLEPEKAEAMGKAEKVLGLKNAAALVLEGKKFLVRSDNRRVTADTVKSLLSKMIEKAKG